MHLWERRCFQDIEIDSSLKLKLEKIENEYGSGRCSNQIFIKYVRSLCDIQKDDDLWYICINNYENMSAKDKSRPSYENYMKKYMNEDYSRKKYDEYVEKVKKR